MPSDTGAGSVDASYPPFFILFALFVVFLIRVNIYLIRVERDHARPKTTAANCEKQRGNQDTQRSHTYTIYIYICTRTHMYTYMLRYNFSADFRLDIAKDIL